MDDFYVRVSFQYNAVNSDELSANEGDILKVTNSFNEHWHNCKHKGKDGLFPASYTTRINSPLQHEIFVATENYQAARPEELSLSRGFNVTVIEEIDSLWWRGECDGKIGIFPNRNVDKLYDSICSDDEGDSSVFYTNVPNDQNCLSVEAVYTFKARNEEELSFPEGAIINVIRDIDDDWYEGAFNGKTGMFPKNHVHAYHDIYEVPPAPFARTIYPFVGENDSELTFKEGEIILLRKRAGSQWLEGEIDGEVGLFPASFVDIEIDLPSEESEPDPVPQKVPLKEGLKMKALYHFSALHPGDLALNEEDIVTIIKVVDDNWIEGEVQSGVTGMCPSAYLTIYDPESSNSFQNNNVNSNSICEQLRQGIFASSNLTRSSQTSTSTGELNAAFCDDTELVSSSRYSDGKASFNKGKPAPKPPQSQSNESLNGIKNNLPSRSLSLSYPNHNSSSQNSYLYAVPVKGHKAKGKSTTAVNTSKCDKKESSVDGKSLIDISVSHRASSFNLASPLLPLPSKTKDAVPIVPKRKAPPPPKKPISDKPATLLRSMSDTPQCPAKANTSAIGSTTSSKPSTRPTPVRRTISELSLSNGNSTAEKSLSPKRTISPPPKKSIFDRSQSSKVVPQPAPRNIEVSLQDRKYASESQVSPRKTRPDGPPQPRRTMSEQRPLTLSKEKIKDSILSDKVSEQYGSSSSIGSVGSSSSDKSTTLKPASSIETSHKQRPPPPPRYKGSVRSATISATSRQSYMQDKKASNPTRPLSLYCIEAQSDEQSMPKKSTSVEDVKLGDREALSNGLQDNVDSIDIALIPGITELDKKIANMEHNMQVECRACTGMKTILLMLVHDTDKYKEMEGKISRSEQKVEEWKDITNGLKNERAYLIKTYPKRKEIEEHLSSLEADLQKQVRSQKSLQDLLKVVEDSRKEEVMENISLCDTIIKDLQTNITEQKDSLQTLCQPKSSKSTQKQFAEQREKVVNELINTEKDYLRDLQLCLKYFAEELQESKVVESGILFGNMSSVVDTSTKLLEKFEQAVKEKDASEQELGKCFVDIADDIKDVYGQYCRNHDDAIGLLEKYEEVPECQELFNKCLNAIRDSTKCWDLSSFLIKPVQRVLKYPLLLSELLKCTPEIHKDKQNLIKAMAVMNDVAMEINEVKRRKDIVLKYKRVEESGISKTFQKLNWHSVLKKSSRFNQRITQMTGLVSQTVDKKFNEQERMFVLLEKAVKNLVKNITAYMEQFQETRSLQCINGDNIETFYQDAATCTEVTLYQSTLKRINNDLFESFVDDVQRLVLSPLTSILALFQGPQRLIQKRQDKCLDFDSKSNRIEKTKDKDKLKIAKSELEKAKKDYEALNTQLLEELPVFHEKTISLVKDCVLNLMQAKRKFHAVFLGEYTMLMLLPMVKDEGDIIEQQIKKTEIVVEQMADLSFIPVHFLGKELTKKKRNHAKKQPKIPSLPASTGDIISSKTATRGGSLSRKRLAPQPPPRLGTYSGSNANKEVPKPTPRRHTVSSPAAPQSSLEINANNFEPYVAIFTFEAQNPGEISLNEGDLVTVQRQSDTSGNNEWWLVSSSGLSGYVPCSFLEKYTEFEEDEESEEETETKASSQNTDSEKVTSYFAQFEFEATSPVELSLDEGQVIKVVQFHDKNGNDEWWLVEAGGKKGYVAANFLAPLENK